MNTTTKCIHQQTRTFVYILYIMINAYLLISYAVLLTNTLKFTVLLLSEKTIIKKFVLFCSINIINFKFCSFMLFKLPFAIKRIQKPMYICRWKLSILYWKYQLLSDISDCSLKSLKWAKILKFSVCYAYFVNSSIVLIREINV